MAYERTQVKVGAIVAWYCNHDDEPLGASSHQSRELVRGQWVIKAKPSVSSSSHGGKERPPCPRALPLRVRKSDLLKALPPYPGVTP